MQPPSSLHHCILSTVQVLNPSSLIGSVAVPPAVQQAHYRDATSSVQLLNASGQAWPGKISIKAEITSGWRTFARENRFTEGQSLQFTVFAATGDVTVIAAGGAAAAGSTAAAGNVAAPAGSVPAAAPITPGQTTDGRMPPPAALLPPRAQTSQTRRARSAHGQHPQPQASQ